MNDPHALSDLYARHRSIRRYKSDPIDPAMIEAIVAEALAGGSSSGNLNAVSVVLTREPERRQRLWELHSRQDMILQAPLVMTVCADWYRTRRWLALRGARDGFKDFLGYHVAAYDAMILAQDIALACEARGLGICYMGTTLYRAGDLVEFLELPETVMPVTSLVVGWPDEAPSRRDRLPVAGLIHDERYRRPSDEDIERIFRDREVKGWERYMGDPGLRAAVEQAGVSSLAQFYTSKLKYDPDFHGERATALVATLQRQGFLP